MRTPKRVYYNRSKFLAWRAALHSSRVRGASVLWIGRFAKAFDAGKKLNTIKVHFSTGRKKSTPSPMLRITNILGIGVDKADQADAQKVIIFSLGRLRPRRGQKSRKFSMEENPQTAPLRRESIVTAASTAGPSSSLGSVFPSRDVGTICRAHAQGRA